MWPSEEEAGERGAEVSCWLLDVPGGCLHYYHHYCFHYQMIIDIVLEVCCCWVALPGGCPGELDEEEEGNAEEGKQGIEEVTCAAVRFLELEITVFVCLSLCLCLSVCFIHLCFTCSMEAGRPGRSF